MSRTGREIVLEWLYREIRALYRDRYDAVIGLADSVMLPCESPLISPLFKTGKDLIEALSLLVS